MELLYKELINACNEFGLKTIDKKIEKYVKTHDIKLCKLYYPPYDFYRIGCKGCPFNQNIQKELDIVQKFFPKERAQCERIWKPVYDEYRRIGYRLKPLDEGRQMTIDEFLKGDG